MGWKKDAKKREELRRLRVHMPAGDISGAGVQARADAYCSENGHRPLTSAPTPTRDVTTICCDCDRLLYFRDFPTAESCEWCRGWIPATSREPDRGSCGGSGWCCGDPGDCREAC